MLSAFACFRWTISQKCSSGEPSSSQRQKTDISSMVATSVHSSAMMLKQEAWWRRFSRNSSTHISRASMNSTTVICEVYTALPPVLSRKLFNSAPPHNTTSSTSFSNWWCGECAVEQESVHNKKRFDSSPIHQSLWSATFWSCWITDPACSDACCAKAAWLAAMCASLFMSFHFFNSFLPVGEWLGCPHNTCSLKWLSRCLTKFAECTLTISIILQPRKVFFPSFYIFPAAATCITILQSLLQKFRYTNTGFLSWRSFYLFFTATITSLLLLLEGTNVDGLLELPK